MLTEVAKNNKIGWGALPVLLRAAYLRPVLYTRSDGEQGWETCQFFFFDSPYARYICGGPRYAIMQLSVRFLL